jgi:hypothetical protein
LLGYVYLTTHFYIFETFIRFINGNSLANELVAKRQNTCIDLNWNLSMIKWMQVVASPSKWNASSKLALTCDSIWPWLNNKCCTNETQVQSLLWLVTPFGHGLTINVAPCFVLPGNWTLVSILHNNSLCRGVPYYIGIEGYRVL